MVRTPTQKELATFVVGHGIVDFVSGGKLSLIERNAIWKAVKKLGAVAGRQAIKQTPKIAGTALRVGKTIAMRHPVLTAGAVVYYTYKNREELGDLVEQGYEVLQPKVPMVQDVLQTAFDATPIGVGLEIGRRIRKKATTPFNKAVSKGMKIVKASTSYGKKGTINNAKKAFSAVTKAASAASKKKKAPKSGITRKIYLGVKGLFK